MRRTLAAVLVSGSMIVASIGCGNKQLGTVAVTGSPNFTVSLDPSSVNAYFVRFCCQVAANNGQVPMPEASPTPSNAAVDACVAAPTTQITDCASGETANLLAAITSTVPKP